MSEQTSAEIAPEEIVVEPEVAPEAQPQEPAPRRKVVLEGAEPEDAEYSAKVQKRIAQLAKQRREAESLVARERARAEAAERALAEAQRQGLTYADQALEQRLQGAQARHQKAFSEGDAAEATKAAADMARLEAERLQVQNAQRQPQQQPPRQQEQQYTPRTQEWIDERPWFNDDPKARGVAFAAHADAVNLGLKPDSDDYFAYVDEKVRGRFPKLYEEQADEEDEPRRTAPVAPVAAARRTAPGAAPVKGKLPSLTAAEASQAKMMGVSLEAYAKQKARLSAAGELGRAK